MTTHTTVNQKNITTVTRDDYRLTVTFRGLCDRSGRNSDDRPAHSHR